MHLQLHFNFIIWAKLFNKTIQVEKRWRSHPSDPKGAAILPQWRIWGALSGKATGVISDSRLFCLEWLAQYLERFSPLSISLHEEMRHHHKSHLCLGFMGAFALQPKCFENSRELDMVPMTRNLDGLWGSVMTPSCELSGVLAEHHTCREEYEKMFYIIIFYSYILKCVFIGSLAFIHSPQSL